MSVSAGDVLDRVEREGIPPLHVRRLQRAAGVVKEALDAAIEAEDPTWFEFAEAIVQAGKNEDWGRMYDLILQGYRRVLIERDPETKNIRIPKTQDEWDAIPDVLPEFKRRYKIAE